MSFGFDLNMNVGMEQRLSPQMIQYLKLLQMTSMELETVIKQELETNPLLETTEEPETVQEEDKKNEDGEELPVAENEIPSEEAVAPEEEPLDRVIAQESKNQEIDWESYLEEGFDPGGKRN